MSPERYTEIYQIPLPDPWTLLLNKGHFDLVLQSLSEFENIESWFTPVTVISGQKEETYGLIHTLQALTDIEHDVVNWINSERAIPDVKRLRLLKKISLFVSAICQESGSHDITPLLSSANRYIHNGQFAEAVHMLNFSKKELLLVNAELDAFMLVIPKVGEILLTILAFSPVHENQYERDEMIDRIEADLLLLGRNIDHLTTGVSHLNMINVHLDQLLGKSRL
jgi:hypothetical protein